MTSARTGHKNVLNHQEVEKRQICDILAIMNKSKVNQAVGKIIQGDE